jgi:hypothetical protein
MVRAQQPATPSPSKGGAQSGWLVTLRRSKTKAAKEEEEEEEVRVVLAGNVVMAMGSYDVSNRLGIPGVGVVDWC